MSCPECNCPPHKSYTHSASCSQIDAASAKFWIGFYKEQWSHSSRIASLWIQNAHRWEGKFRIVCHENNQLRKQQKTNPVKP